MKLYHGSYQEIRPEIKIGEFALKGLDNVFDGLFASDYKSEAEAHGKFIHEFDIEDDKIANSQDLDVPEIVFDVLKKETNIEDEEKIEALYNIVLDDGDYNDLIDAEISEEDLNCRASCDFEFGAASWEIPKTAH